MHYVEISSQPIETDGRLPFLFRNAGVFKNRVRVDDGIYAAIETYAVLLQVPLPCHYPTRNIVRLA